VTIDTTRTLAPTNFYAAYQGENDRPLHANLGRIYRGVDLCKGREVEGRKGRLRVGFLSAYFRDHTISRLNIGRIEHLPRDEFSVTVFSVGQHRDEMAERFRRAADRYVALPRDVAEA
jgi:predicted O-linked N-acetylglucosamine transferase (SPINDLY family)